MSLTEILRELINEGKVIVHLDDILIFTEDLPEHQRLVHRVLAKLREQHLYLKGSKCFLEEEEISYLGLIVGGGMMKTDPKKIEIVLQIMLRTCLRKGVMLRTLLTSSIFSLCCVSFPFLLSLFACFSSFLGLLLQILYFHFDWCLHCSGSFIFCFTFHLRAVHGSYQGSIATAFHTAAVHLFGDVWASGLVLKDTMYCSYT